MPLPPDIAARDAALRQAAAEHGLGAAALADEAASYYRSAWQREKGLERCPPRHHGRLEAHLWTALKAWPWPPCAEVVAAILAPPAATPTAQPMTGAERQRRWRQRQRTDLVQVRVEVDPDAINALVSGGYLRETAAQDKAAVARAIEAKIRDAVTP
jgi:hypothetical protein